MPSFAEIFIVSGVDVPLGVSVNGICVGSGVVVDIVVGVMVDGGGVAVLWQAASKKMERRSGMIFFMFFSLSLRGRSLFLPEAISFLIA